MKIISLYIFIPLLLLSIGCAAQANNNKRGAAFINGQWFDGSGFKAKAFYTVDGRLTEDRPAHIDITIYLEGQYVIPPFAEAHNHNLESDYQLKERIDSYLDSGVFYVKHLSSIKKRVDPLMHHFNKPTGIDISLAHAPLTATGGHPIALRKGFLEAGYFDGLFSSLEEIESHGYFIVDNSQDLQQKWDKILSFSPDFIKVNLLYSEEYEKRKNDTTYFGIKGLNPELIPEIVKKAPQSNLRVSAHVSSAHDFHVAVEAGVDEVAHLPGIHNGDTIAKSDAKLAKEKGTIVVTTASLVTKDEEKPNYQELVENVRLNLQLLKQEGVTLAIGSDMYNDNSVGESKFLNELNIFSNLELLKMWCVNAAQTTFPDRKIGHLMEGYEASFLVLEDNPLDNFEAIEQIVLRVKQRVVIE